MTPETFSAANRMLNAPPGWDEAKHGRCDVLPVYSDGEGALLSQWRPSWRERLAILFGRSVRLWVIADRHPPVTLRVHKRGEP